MTTEIAILNRSAVALAADSAVSVVTPAGIKVYSGVNKLFELIKGRPVGVMVYNGAELSHRPWETVIKAYREERSGQSMPTIDEYVADFRAFIRRHRELFSPRQQDEALTSAVASDLMGLKNEIVRGIRDALASRRPASQRLVTTIVAKVVRRYWNGARSSCDLAGWQDASPSLRTLVAQHRPMLDDLIDDVFEHFPLTDALRANLRVGLVHRAFGRNDEDGEFSGIVIAGFGDNEYYPRLREFRTKAMYAGRLLSSDVEDSRSDIGVSLPADIKAFAQGDMIRSFTDGIQDGVRRRTVEYWLEWVKSVGETARSDPRLAGLGATERSLVTAVVNDLSGKAVNGFLGNMADYEQTYVKGPLLQSVAFLPKDELGAMAESLVNLTTLKRRVSINEAQTVGGAVDVAVVSRGDGFVWLKRKHYFDQELNPSWPSTHAAQPVRDKE